MTKASRCPRVHRCLAGASCTRRLDYWERYKQHIVQRMIQTQMWTFWGTSLFKRNKFWADWLAKFLAKSSLLWFQIIPSGRVYAQPVCKLSFLQPYAPWNETKLINISNAPRDTLNPFTFRWSMAEAGHALHTVRMLSHSAACWPQSPVCLVSVNTKASCPRRIIKQNPVYSATVWMRCGSNVPGHASHVRDHCARTKECAAVLFNRPSS